MSNRPFTEENFEQTFKTYFGPLCNYVNSHIQDWEGSREIVQGTFMKIWENKDAIEVSTTAKTYLYKPISRRFYLCNISCRLRPGLSYRIYFSNNGRAIDLAQATRSFKASTST